MGKPTGAAPKAKAAHGEGRLGNGGAPAVTDPRFASMHRDPRFASFPNKKNTVEIDSRFSGMFSDPDFQTKSAVDKRGRKVKSSKRGEDLKRYYHLKDEADWKEDAEGAAGDVAGEGEEHGVAGVRLAAAMAEEAAVVGPDAGQAKQDGKKGKKAEQQAAEDEGVKAPAKGKVQPQRGGGGEAGPGGKKGSKAAAAQARKASREEEEEEEEEDEKGDKEEEAARLRFLRARGMLGVSSSSDEEGEAGGESDEGEEEDGDGLGEEEQEQDAEKEWGVGALAANPAEEIPMMDETRRMAIVDLDWDHVKAVDILAVLRSFAPKGGEVSRVTVYPSDYGLERMAQEAALGPQHIFAKAAAAKAKQNGSGNGAAGKQGSAGEEEDAEEEEEEEAAAGSQAEIDKKRLAMYEKSKLRYYYAIVECDSAATASQVYAECDGLEFERSACKFDLRFVPDEQSFQGRQVRDTATSVPSGYEPPQAFNLSLQHTDPKLSWDADDEGRKRQLQKRLTEDEIKDADFEAYLGSDGEEDEEGVPGGAHWEDKDPEKIRERYRSLLLGGSAADDKSKSWKGAGDEDDEEGGDGGEDEEDGEEPKDGAAKRVKGRDGMEMEVTFVSGLENLGSKLLAKKHEKEARKGETVWEAYLRRKKEKRKERKHGRGKTAHEDDSSDSDDYDRADRQAGGGDAGPAAEDDPFDDPFFKDDAAGEAVSSGEEDAEEAGRPGPSKQAPAAAKGGKEAGKGGKAAGERLSKEERKRAKEEEQRTKAELELLLMDDGALREAAVRGMPGALKDAAAGVSGRGLEDEDEEGPGAGGRKKKQSRKERLRLKKEAKRAAREGSDEEDAQQRHQRAGSGAAASAAPEGGARHKGKGKGAAQQADGDAPEQGFHIDMSDPRFAVMFEDHNFALDPTDPRFAKTKGADVLAKEMSKRRSSAPPGGGPTKQQQRASQAAPPTAAAPAEKDAALQKLELKAMVAKLKRKAEGPSAGAKRAKQ